MLEQTLHRGRYDRQTVPVHKWGWKFSADRNAKEAEKRELTAFLRKVEVFRGAERSTYEDIHRKFHFLVGEVCMTGTCVTKTRLRIGNS